MTPADHYRALAARFRAHARTSGNARLAAEWDNLARCYLRLAEQARRNDRLDIVYETPVRRDCGPPEKS